MYPGPPNLEKEKKKPGRDYPSLIIVPMSLFLASVVKLTTHICALFSVLKLRTGVMLLLLGVEPLLGNFAVLKLLLLITAMEQWNMEQDGSAEETKLMAKAFGG
ncbi:hypothetical protein GTR04_3205 [Trichophyton interdigitale]|uniref:Uncharacterized protein n=1 Tax=Trichophyton interdigitale (strain MR816) TaxID=1215338 RepID=A0A059JJW9_TRIIM|nr:hypothetical protein H101_03869 [Trichophyton interdigitale H6]KAF3894436.1 hypothetical protein GY631_3136 [Trichophyton interdigitale]KAG5218452.1 hypothetical protein GY632_5548 [Trichophyton interdigitale]KAG8209432.1 hypothetical protein GTR04_3205 [Trichophyton interdigitale]KDB27762.1 hypothetical protein H109_00473 [Trichophyton interdigitale MR816]